MKAMLPSLAKLAHGKRMPLRSCQPMTLVGLCAALVLIASAAVHAAYSNNSTSNDIMKSCKNFSVGTEGVLSLTCNEWNSWGVWGTKNHTLDLDARVGNSDGSLKYSSTDTTVKDFSIQCNNEKVEIKNDQLILSANCPDSTGFNYFDSSVRVDEDIYNNGSTSGQSSSVYFD